MKPDSIGKHLLIGLGNPGPEYKKTRHNAGFLVVEALSSLSGVRFKKPFLKPWLETVVSCAEQGPDGMVLIKPLTYMNRSGTVVEPLLRRFRTDLASLIVIYDTLDLSAGRIRIRPSGSGGGQKGISSIIEHLNTDAFMRIAVGVGRPDKKEEVISWVLGCPEGEELTLFRQGIDLAVKAASDLCLNPVEQVMSLYNGRK